MKAKLVLAILCAAAVPAIAAEPAAPTLDEQAWNTVWDKLEEVLRRSRNSELSDREVVNILRMPVPLASGIGLQFEGQGQLEQIAGVIPKRQFALDVSDQDRRLHDEYYNVLKSLVVPASSPEDLAKQEKALAELEAANTALEKEVERWGDRIDKEFARLRTLGQTTVTDQQYVDTRAKTVGNVYSKLQTVKAKLTTYENLLPPNSSLIAAVRQINEYATAAEVAASGSGLWGYRLSETVGFEKSSCDPKQSAGWEELIFNSSTKSQKFRADSWNANGSWSGSFVSVGLQGGKGSFSNVIRTSSDKISLRFCQMRYIPVTAPWFSMVVLRDVDLGRYGLKPGSGLKGQKVLGPNGRIPRIVKGVIVARDIELTGKIEKSLAEEARSQSGGGGGFRIGGWGFGGSKSRVRYTASESKEEGVFGLSSGYGRPIVLAVLLEDTEAPPAPAEVDK